MGDGVQGKAIYCHKALIANSFVGIPAIVG